MKSNENVWPPWHTVLWEDRTRQDMTTEWAGLLQTKPLFRHTLPGASLWPTAAGWLSAQRSAKDWHHRTSQHDWNTFQMISRRWNKMRTYLKIVIIKTHIRIYSKHLDSWSPWDHMGSLHIAPHPWICERPLRQSHRILHPELPKGPWGTMNDHAPSKGSLDLARDQSSSTRAQHRTTVHVWTQALLKQTMDDYGKSLLQVAVL